MGTFRIFEKLEFWDTATAGLIKAVTTQGIATIHLPSEPSLDGLLKHTLVNSEPSALGANMQNKLT